MPKKTDIIYRQAVRTMQKAYNDALETAIRKSKEFYKKVDAVNSGKIPVPSGLKTQKQIEAWRRGYLQRAEKTEKVVESIVEEMRLAGLKTRKVVQAMIAKLYGAESKATIAILDKSGKYGLTAPTSAQINVLLRKSATVFEKIALQHLGQSGNATQKLRKSLATGISKGESTEQLLKRIQDITGTKESDAMRILRTEKTRVCGQAQQEMCEEYYKLSGKKPRKRWICTFRNSRDWHISLHRETVDYDEPFSNGLMYPGDPNGGAEEVINCMCFMEVLT